jgi:muramoyltetrapeptide carboxypeptidase
MKQAPFLLPGDTIGILAPARKISRQELEPVSALITSWGWKVRYSAHLFGESNQFSGTDAERAEDFLSFLKDPEIKAILCARGGYGSVRVAELLKMPFQHPKWIIGYSDITVFHHWAVQQGWESAHATMPVNMKDLSGEAFLSNESLRKMLAGDPETLQLPFHPLNREGSAEGRLTGGNLSVIYSLMGSDLQPDTRGKILFLEDLDEYLYHVDRMMMCLKRGGLLSDLSALIIGGMSGMRDNAVPFGKTAEEIIKSAVEEYKYPVFFGADFGHQPLNRALIHGRTYRLEDNLLIPRPFFGADFL